ncbi:MAG TPA: hypothetical protein EYN51_06410 [Flavobacteriales bacterium]|nr:hypothetical protein [Flavobacteriales bacterium]
MQQVKILDNDGKVKLDKRGREVFCYSLDANEAIRQGAYVVAESHIGKVERTGREFTVITAVRPKTTADKRKETVARKKAAEKDLAAAEATLRSEEVLDLAPKYEEPPVSNLSIKDPIDEPVDVIEEVPEVVETPAPIKVAPAPKKKASSPRRK